MSTQAKSGHLSAYPVEEEARVLDHIASEASHGRPRVAEDYETLTGNLLAVASRLRRLLPEEEG